MQTILEGMKDTRDIENIIKKHEKDRIDMIYATMSNSNAEDEVPDPVKGMKPSSIRKHRGGVIPVKWDSANFRARYHDDTLVILCRHD